jgi:hypothetical protein
MQSKEMLQNKKTPKNKQQFFGVFRLAVTSSLPLKYFLIHICNFSAHSKKAAGIVTRNSEHGSYKTYEIPSFKAYYFQQKTDLPENPTTLPCRSIFRKPASQKALRT